MALILEERAGLRRDTNARLGRRLVFGLMGLFLALGIVYNLSIPPQLSIDEGHHFGYVQDILRDRGLPVVGPGASSEEFEPPLYYLIAAAASQSGLALGLAPRLGISEAMLILRVSRVVSLLAGLVTVWCAWELSGWFFRRRPWLRAGVVALLALDPTFLSISGSVTNDSLAIALGAVAILIAARIASTGLAWRWTVLAGLVLGLGALTKLSALVGLAPVLGALLLIGILQQQPRRAAQHALVVIALVPAVAGWWWWRGWVLYRDPFGGRLQAMLNPLLVRAGPLPLSAYPPSLADLGATYLAAIGPNASVRPPIWVPAIWLLLLGLALVALGRLAWRRRSWRSLRSPRVRIAAILVLAVAANLLAVVIYAQKMDGIWHGRFLMPSGIALAVLLGLGLQAWSPRRWVVLIAALLALALAMPLVALRPVQAASELRPASRAAMAVALDDEFAGSMHLAGVTLARPTVTPGRRVALTLYWEATAPVLDEETLFVHLDDAQQRTVAQYNGSFSMRYWPPGRLYATRVSFDLPSDVLPGDYTLRAGMFRAIGNRLVRPDVSVDGVPRALTEVTLAPLAVRAPGPATILSAPQVQFADGAALTDWRWQAGTLTLDWTTDRRLTRSYTVFVHLLNAQGQVVAQHDGLPADGNFPTTAWRPGDRILDPHPMSAPPGVYRAEVGLYDRRTGARVRTLDGTDRILLGPVLVTGRPAAPGALALAGDDG